MTKTIYLVVESLPDVSPMVDSVEEKTQFHQHIQ
jgi:hypothetical protein